MSRRLIAAGAFLPLFLLGGQMAAAPDTMASPVAGTLARQGEALYAQKGCASCHGADLMGTGGNPAVAGKTAAALDDSIDKDGTVMGSMFGGLTEPERNALGEYMQSVKPLSPSSAQESAAPSDTAQASDAVARGKQLYDAKCAGCHAVASAIRGKTTAALDAAIASLPIMASLASLPAEDRQAIATYIQSL